MSLSYYNELDPYAAQWLRNLIDAGLIAPGDVDTRSIVDVQPDDLAGYRQCHFFAGIGGWPLATRLARFPDDRELWTGSPPCQPFSVAGQGKAQGDDRHLWPHLARLVRARRPAVLMGEQVAAAVGKDWLDGVFADLEGIGYACGAAVVPACAVDAPHRRDRLWFVAHAEHGGCEGWNAAGPQVRPGSAVSSGKGAMADADGARREQGRRHHPGDGHGHTATAEAEAGSDRRSAWGLANTTSFGSSRRDAASMEGRAEPGREAQQPQRCSGSAWDGAGWITGHDGKHRRTPEPGIRLLAHGVPARVGRLRAYGNAIVPEIAAEVIGAFMDCYPERVAA